MSTGLNTTDPVRGIQVYTRQTQYEVYKSKHDRPSTRSTGLHTKDPVRGIQVYTRQTKYEVYKSKHDRPSTSSTGLLHTTDPVRCLQV